MDCLDFLSRQGKLKPRPAYVLHGDEPFLRTLARQAIRSLAAGEADEGLSASYHPGDRATWQAVCDDLQAVPMFSACRVVFVDEADPFVSRERGRLEKLFTELASVTEVRNILVLDVKSWPANTRLAKLAPKDWEVVCDTPRTQALPAWCVDWCQQRHGKALADGAARLLVELVGPQMGLLDSEMAKLAVYVGPSPSISVRDVDTLVGASRMEDTWKLFDLIGAGQGGEAVAYLGRLLGQGKEPMELLGAFSVKLRQLAQAGRMQAQGASMVDALKRAGAPVHFPAARQSAEKQMRHLGPRRLARLYDLLLEADSGMKGGSQLSPRLLLERLVVQLARGRG
jgi:DNA polymerase-3 subunit delta